MELLSIVSKGKVTTKLYGVVEIFLEDYRDEEGISISWYAENKRKDVVANANTKKELYDELGVKL